MLNKLRITSLTNYLGACLLAGVLAACGGGGTNDGCVNVDPSRSSTLPGCGVGSTNPGTGTSAATLAMSMTDGGGTALADLTPDKGATITVTLKDTSGAAIRDAVVTFVTTDSTAVFSPSSGTALTNSSGTASVKLAAGTQAGAFTVNASSTVGSAAVKTSKNYTVSFPTLSLSDIQVSPSTLSAGGNASVVVSVMSGTSVYTLPVSVAFSSPCIAAGKALIGTPVITQNGMAVASYTDKGCGTADTLTTTVKLPNATLTKSATITVLPAAAGSIKFVGVDTSNIALKGTGGPGRPEYSTVKFQVFDKNGSPVVGKLVNFHFADTGTSSTTGGLTLNPTSATTASDGTVTTAVSDGTVPTSVRAVATVDGSAPPLTSVSSVLVVSSGVPDQQHFSLSTETGNCEGWNIDQVCSIVKAIVGDHFGNPVPDGTAVNFTVENNGVISASCLTEKGVCTATLHSAGQRVQGRITVLAYALGEESFFDANGNNVFDAGDTFSDKSPDIHRDDNESGNWTAGEPCITSKPSVDCNTAGDGQYNGVLRMPQLPSSQTLYVSNQLVQQFSTSSAAITFGAATLTCTPNTSIDAQVTVKDLNGLWMPAGSSISFSAQFGAAAGSVSPSSAIVPNVVLGIGSPLNIPTYTVSIACPTPDVIGELVVTVRSPSGVVTVAKKTIN